MFAPGCAGRVYDNPPPPQMPEPTPEPLAPAGAAGSTGAPVEPVGAEGGRADASLPDPPKGGDGRVVRNADGTCLYVYPTPVDRCPPEATCNPGPPRRPLPVKCTGAEGK